MGDVIYRFQISYFEEVSVELEKVGDQYYVYVREWLTYPGMEPEPKNDGLVLDVVYLEEFIQSLVNVQTLFHSIEFKEGGQE